MAPSNVDAVLLPTLGVLGGALIISTVTAVVKHLTRPKPRRQQPVGGAKAGKAKKKDKGKAGKPRGGDEQAAQQPPKQRQTVASAPPPAASLPPPAPHKPAHGAPVASQPHSGGVKVAVGGVGGVKGGAALPRAAPASQAVLAVAPRSPPKSASVPPTHRGQASVHSTESESDSEEGGAVVERPAAVPQGAVTAVPSGVVSGEPDDSWQVRQALLLCPCSRARVSGWGGRALL
jgi:hypothetical protein